MRALWFFLPKRYLLISNNARWVAKRRNPSLCLGVTFDLSIYSQIRNYNLNYPEIRNYNLNHAEIRNFVLNYSIIRIIKLFKLIECGMIHTAENTNEAKHLSKLYNDKKLRKICQGIYTDDLHTSLERIVLENWMQIVSYVVSNGILSYRTALELRPLPFKQGSIVFVISTYSKTMQIHGLTIKVNKGNHTDFLEQILPGLARSNTTRLLLENLAVIRGKEYQGIKTIGIEGVEQKLTRELSFHGEIRLNQIRDEAKKISMELDYINEYQKLNHIISALLATNPDKNSLITPYAKAAAQQKPYDNDRIELFEELIVHLKKSNFLSRNYHFLSNSFKNLSFYESYFSNFIEGTEFLIDEAEDIVFKGIEIKNRFADTHDVLSNFSLTNDYSEMLITPQTTNEFIEILQRRHAILMKGRPEKNPGEFKKMKNKAGNTFFVDPKETLGTLYQGFELYKHLNPGLEKALFMQFLISEVHPFDDGNGRLSRIMMNSELVNNSSYKIIVPSVHRDNYLNGLRLGSRDKNFRTYLKVMDQAQAYTASIDWNDYGDARKKIEEDDAHLTSDEGIAVFNRILRQLSLSNISA